jgi:hypothetical protein
LHFCICCIRVFMDHLKANTGKSFQRIHVISLRYWIVRFCTILRLKSMFSRSRRKLLACASVNRNLCLGTKQQEKNRRERMHVQDVLKKCFC